MIINVTRSSCSIAHVVLLLKPTMLRQMLLPLHMKFQMEETQQTLFLTDSPSQMQA